MIDHQLRFNPNRKKIKEWISNGDLGTIQHINILNVSNGLLVTQQALFINQLIL